MSRKRLFAFSARRIPRLLPVTAVIEVECAGRTIPVTSVGSQTRTSASFRYRFPSEERWQVSGELLQAVDAFPEQFQTQRHFFRKIPNSMTDRFQSQRWIFCKSLIFKDVQFQTQCYSTDEAQCRSQPAFPRRQRFAALVGIKVGMTFSTTKRG
jgi:hypothetical protein